MSATFDAVMSLRPRAQFTAGETYESIVWNEPADGQTKPTKSEVIAEIDRLNQQYINNEYQRKREKQYPSIKEQLDMQYWDVINGTTTWQDAINAVKAKYPKPTES
jgi:basic membrane lipoprotein Med (substrate-binding protein (PBP1-ABC) superfamily)